MEYNIRSDKGSGGAAKKLQQGITQAEDARKEGYGTALNMMEQRHLSQRRERDRLAAKYGENHTRVQAMDRRLAGNAVIGKATKTQQYRAQNAEESADRGTWKMMGRVVNDQGMPLANLTVSLFGETSGWERALGHTCTDEAGYYSLAVTDPQIVMQYQGRNLIPTVTDQDRKILYQDSKPVSLTSGESKVLHMVIKGAKCTAPEEMYGMWGEMPPNDSGASQVGMVHGYVTSTNGAAQIGVTVVPTCYLHDSDYPLAYAKTDEKGYYKVNFFPGEIGLDSFVEVVGLAVKVYDATGKYQMAETPIDMYSPYDARIDVAIDFDGK